MRVAAFGDGEVAQFLMDTRILSGGLYLFNHEIKRVSFPFTFSV